MNANEKHPGTSARPISRRQLLGAAAAAGTMMVVPRHVLGGAEHTPPSEKLNIAGVGIGGQGGEDLKELSSQNIVALADVDWDYAAHTFKQYPGAKKYKDFRRMLDKEKGIDAVVVGTPDHAHAIVSMAAIKLGKHVYCEKPLTRTVFEARTGREGRTRAQGGHADGQPGHGLRGQPVDQRMDQRRRHRSRARGTRLVGPADAPRQGAALLGAGVERPKDQPPVPSTLDWDLWLGPAPWRPYHPAYAPFRWRGWWDFGSGGLGDMGVHNIAPVFSALDLGSPTSVSASSTAVYDETLPLACCVHYEFPARAPSRPSRFTGTTADCCRRGRTNSTTAAS